MVNEDLKVSLFADDVIIHIHNPKELMPTTKSLLGLISNYNKFSGYKVNLQESIAFLYQ